MLPAGLIMFREGLEAALIVGIVMGYLTRIGQRGQLRYAWLGVLLAIGASAAIALSLQAVGEGLAEPYEQIFEGTTMLLAVGVLTWMIFWMRYQGRFMKRDLEHKVQSALASSATLGVLGITFLAVLREGIETALFLSASAFAENAAVTWAGALVGLALAIAAGYALYIMAVRLNVRFFFDVTSLMLLVFAAGLFVQAIHEYQEIGWLPVLAQQAWNIEAILPESSVVGSLLHAMVGYNDAPSVLEVLGYLSYWGILLVSVRWWTQKLGTRLSAQRA